MRAVVTRVANARVEIDGRVNGQIHRGLLVLLGMGPEDTPALADKMADKVCGLRIFEDEAGRMNLNLAAVGGALAIEAASNFNIDVMFFSAYGVNDRGMIVDTSEPETQLRSYLLKNAATSIFLCDSSKFGRSAMYNVAPLSQVNYMITDGAVPSQFPPVKDGVILVE